MMIVSLALTPSLVSASILITEAVHLSIYFYYVVRYRYAKNWILIVSKFNVGLTIMYFSFLAFVLSLRQDTSEEMSFVASTLQGFGMTVAINCFLLETLLLILNITTAIYEAYANWRNGIPKKKIIASIWEKTDGVSHTAKCGSTVTLDKESEGEKAPMNVKLNKVHAIDSPEKGLKMKNKKLKSPKKKPKKTRVKVSKMNVAEKKKEDDEDLF